MAGIFAPQLNEISAAPIGISSTPDASVPNLLSGVGNIIDSLGRNRTTATQSDRDDAALRPAFADMQRLVALRDSGKLKSGEFTIRARALNKSTVAGFPHLRETISNGFSLIAGEELDIQINPPNIGQELIEADTEFALNDPEARSRLSEAIIRNPDKSINAEKSQLAVSALVASIQSSRAKSELRKRNVEDLKNQQAFDNLQQAAAIDPLLADMTLIAQDGVNASIVEFFNNPERTSLDAQEVLTGLNTLKATYEQNFIREAADSGVLDEDRFRSGLGVVMSVFDRQIEAFTALAANEQRVAEILNAEDEQVAINMFRMMGVPRNNQSEGIVAINMLAQNSVAVDTAMKNTTKQLQLSATKESTVGDTLDSEGALTPEAEAIVSTLSQADRVDDINANIDGFLTIEQTDDAVLSSVDNRRFLAEKFVLASNIITTTGVPLDEASFDKVFPPKLLKQYDRITAFDDDISNSFKNAVGNGLENALDRRRNVVNLDIANGFSSEFPSMALKWDGSNYVVVVGQNGSPQTDKERNLFSALQTANLPFTLEGVEELGKLVRTEQITGTPSGLDPKFVRTFELTTFNVQKGNFVDLKDNLRFLNKVVGTIGIFPDELSVPILPSEVGFAESNVVLIDSLDQLNALEPGTPYTLKGRNRNLDPLIRGEEIIPGEPDGS